MNSYQNIDWKNFDILEPKTTLTKMLWESHRFIFKYLVPSRWLYSFRFPYLKIGHKNIMAKKKRTLWQWRFDKYTKVSRDLTHTLVPLTCKSSFCATFFNHAAYTELRNRKQ